MRMVRVCAVAIGVLMLGVVATSEAVAPAGAGLLMLAGVGLVIAGIFAGRAEVE